MRHLWLVLALTLASCATGTEDTTGDTDTDTDADTDSDTDTDTDDTGPTCGETPPDVCDNNVACHSIKGFDVVDDGAGGFCVDKSGLPVRIGCIDKDVDCTGSQKKWAKPPGAPDDKCFAVIGTCVPRDYVDCTDPDMETEVECPAE